MPFIRSTETLKCWEIQLTEFTRSFSKKIFKLLKLAKEGKLGQKI